MFFFQKEMLNIIYRYTQCIGRKGITWLCFADVMYKDNLTTFYATARTKVHAKTLVVHLVMNSSVMIKWQMSSRYISMNCVPQTIRVQNVITCSSGVVKECRGCRECDDSSSIKLSEDEVNRLNDELSEYMKYRDAIAL